MYTKNCRYLQVHIQLLSILLLLIIGTYKPPSLSDITFTSEIKNMLTFYRSAHDNILVMGKFNMTLDNLNFN